MKKIISCFALTILFFACKKTETSVPTDEAFSSEKSSAIAGAAGSNPTVTTNTASIVTSATATSGGSVSSSGGGSQVTERGVCYNTSPNPTTANNKVASGSGSGSFTSILSGLSGSTTYYARAYAIKSTGTTYGGQVVFTTLPYYGTVTDFDGNVYNTITIGSQVWTTSNLKTTHYRNGTLIPNVTDNTAWAALSTGAYSNYNNDEANVATYGRLYNWYAVADANNIAPAGWHAPSYTELYTTLMNSLGGCGSQLVGKKLKDNILWNGDNSSGFRALPGGSRYSGNGTFGAINFNGYWWTSTTLVSNPANAWFLDQAGDDGSCGFVNPNYNKKMGYSIRLVKD